MTDAERVKKDIEELYLGNLGTVEFDLKLPEQGGNGSVIRWESGNLNWMDHEGRVSRPAYGRGNREVILTAVFRYGNYEENRQYPVTVLEEKNRIEAEEVYPIRLTVPAGKRFYLPMAAAVRTKDGRVISHDVEWDAGASREWVNTGVYTVAGRLRDTRIPVTGSVEVVTARFDSARDAAGSVIAVRPERVEKLVEALGGGSVTLTEGSDFYDAQERMHAFLLKADTGQWLYNFRAAAGLATGGAKPMLGWDSPEGLLRGHSTGHFLSALALCYAATQDEEILQKAIYMVDELFLCQKKLEGMEGCHRGFLSAYPEEQFDLLEQYTPYPKIWAPYYTLHKILAGLIDLNCLAGIEKAGRIAFGIGEWVYERLSRLSHEQRSKMWSIYIAGEYGGMNDSMARLYRLTGKQEYLEAASFFENDRLFFPLTQKVDALNGMHANQHIPQIVGAVRTFEMTGEKRLYEIASFFWEIVTGAHIYAIGGTGESEMFHEPGRIASLLTKSTTESCASYNMLKLTQALYEFRPDVKYMDYYERTVCNHILSSCDHRPTGGSTYFMSMRPKAVKDFDLSENSCCHGTGMESHFKYVEGIYYTDGTGVYVNLFIPSRLELTERNWNITMETDERRPGFVTLRVEAEGEFELRVRKPYWCTDEIEVRIDGTKQPATAEDGYLKFKRVWSGVTRIGLNLPYRLRYEIAPDRPGYFTVCYGPYVLAALTDGEERLRLGKGKPGEAFEPAADSPLSFRCRENGILFIPFSKVWKEEYQVYLTSM